MARPGIGLGVTGTCTSWHAPGSGRDSRLGVLNGEGSCAAPAHAACEAAAPRPLPGARLGAGGAERGCAGERRWARWQAGLHAGLQAGWQAG